MHLAHIKYIWQWALEDWNRGVSVGGRRILNLKYAYDTTLIAADEDEMADRINKVKVVELKRTGRTLSSPLGHCSALLIFFTSIKLVYYL